jgi:hypothetical protein
VSSEFTHRGTAVTTYHCEVVGRRVPLLLRELKVLWEDNHGRRYRKTNGTMTGTFTPPLILQLDSVEKYVPEIENLPGLEIDA